MSIACSKCGSPISPDQAFCPKCGAVQGATNQRREESGFDMAATMVGHKLPVRPPAPPPPVNPPPVQTPQPSAAPPYEHHTVSPVIPTSSGSSNRAIYLILGLFAVLVLGGILAFFVYVIFSGN